MRRVRTSRLARCHISDAFTLTQPDKTGNWGAFGQMASLWPLNCSARRLWNQVRESQAITYEAECVPPNIKPPLCKQNQSAPGVFGRAVGVVLFKFIISTLFWPCFDSKGNWPRHSAQFGSQGEHWGVGRGGCHYRMLLFTFVVYDLFLVNSKEASPFPASSSA